MEPVLVLFMHIVVLLLVFALLWFTGNLHLG